MKTVVLLSIAGLWATAVLANEMPQRIPGPKGNIAVLYQSPKGVAGRLAFVDRKDHEVFSEDYSESGYKPGPGQWTASGRFFVYPLLSRDRKPIFTNNRFDIVDIQTRRVFVGDELLDGNATTSEFKLSKEDTVTFYEVDYKGRRALCSVSLAEKIPSLGGESWANVPSEQELHPYYVAAAKAQETGTCNVHKIAMRRMLVPIAWGLFDNSTGPLPSTEVRFFPHAREYVNGGCEVDPARKHAKVSIYVCPECRRAEWQWIKAHPRDPWSKSRLNHHNI